MEGLGIGRGIGREEVESRGWNVGILVEGEEFDGDEWDEENEEGNKGGE